MVWTHFHLNLSYISCDVGKNLPWKSWQKYISITTSFHNIINLHNHKERGHGAMVRAWRSVDVAACRAVSNPACCRIFREISCFSPLNLGTLSRCPWARHFTLKCFTWLRWKWVPGRTEMAMCTISSMRRNGCRTVRSPWSRNGSRMNRSSDQGVRCKVGWWVFRL